MTILPMAMASAMTSELSIIGPSGGAPEVETPPSSICRVVLDDMRAGQQRHHAAT